MSIDPPANEPEITQYSLGHSILLHLFPCALATVAYVLIAIITHCTLNILGALLTLGLVLSQV